MTDAAPNTPPRDTPMIVEVPAEPARLDPEAAERLLRLLLDLPKKRPR
jgi:hypothetical protein